VSLPAIDGLGRLPPFSPILNRLLATIASDEASFDELTALIENDTVLAGNVLKLVNSALYAFQGTVNSVRHAVTILGVDKLRNVALSLSVARMWTHVETPDGWSGAKFNLHSVATALLSDLLAHRSAAPYSEGAFVAGLLHDIGKLLIAISLPREFAEIRRLRNGTARPEVDCEREVIGVTHAELSGAVLERWNLPSIIERAAACHHAPDTADGARPHLSHTVNAADRLANGCGYSTSGRPEETGARETVLDMLQLGEQAPRILDEFQLEFEVLKAFF
jgi:HD-like signal output (HDOD) protein